jgi:predicted metalloprotease with PDZ domain
MPHYTLRFADPAAHQLEITMVIDKPRAAHRVSMPVWIPGSYMVREFSRNVMTLDAAQNGASVASKKIDKATWEIDCAKDKPITITYRVYGWDRSVRSNYFDQLRGFVNPAASMLRDDFAPDASCMLDVDAPIFSEGFGWRCATSMTPIAVDARGFGRYTVSNYDELIDHPLECAVLDEFTFEAGGVPHRFVISGRHRGDLERLKRDTQKICQGHIDLFGDIRPPFDQYVFQLHVVDDGYGGLEHRASTALICPRNDLPVKGVSSVSEGYQSLLALISHEYFHAWNVKRIKPAAFTPYDVTQENYTTLLWLFEGFTSYYDELMLLRVGLITEADYLKLISRHLTQNLRTPARRLQNLAESSFDAWTKYYRQDENAPNAVVSYYLKGGLIALLLDLHLRTTTKNTLDDVMRHLWQHYGKTGVGVPENAFAIFSTVTGIDLSDFESRFVSGCDEPDWAAAFALMGVAYATRASITTTDRGGASPANADSETHPRHWGMIINDAGDPALRVVINHSSAHAAGLCAGDVLTAIDGLRATRSNLSKHFARITPGEKIEIAYFRHDVLRTTSIVAPNPAHDTASLVINSKADETIRSLRSGWLSGAMR